MSKPEEDKGTEASPEIGPILRRAARLPDGKIKSGIAKAAVTTELVKGTFNMDTSVEPEEPRRPLDREYDSDAEAKLGFVEGRQAEEARREEMIAGIEDRPLASDGIVMQEKVFTAAPGAAADVERQLSGRALSGNIAPIPPVRVGEGGLSLPITPGEIAAGRIRVASDSHPAESGEVQERTIIPGPDGPTTV